MSTRLRPGNGRPRPRDSFTPSLLNNDALSKDNFFLKHYAVAVGTL